MVTFRVFSLGLLAEPMPIWGMGTFPWPNSNTNRAAPYLTQELRSPMRSMISFMATAECSFASARTLVQGLPRTPFGGGGLSTGFPLDSWSGLLPSLVSRGLLIFGDITLSPICLTDIFPVKNRLDSEWQASGSRMEA